ncbi:zincin-like metallopeptidase toxin domain-containing protein [Chryseobacterium sp. 'Rf worker isolate 10']|uniref:zincin-like metallopeptidase toxin domain-containing protein n=1 Tax=Chryseobacterium sp. 'Rf worker isolate 10' TaxID=2887348 RepID=UPI003D6FB5D3
MKNTDYKDVFDIGEEALSMKSKFSTFSNPLFTNTNPGESIRGMNNVSPLATYKFYNQNTSVINNKYYPSAKSFQQGNSSLVIDPKIDKNGFSFYKYEFFSDTNRNDMVNSSEKLAFKLLLFVSTDGNKVKECYEVVKPAEDEVIFFLETDDDTLSDDVLYGRVSDKIKKTYTDQSSGKIYKTFFDGDIMDRINKHANNVSKEIIEELFLKGYIEKKGIKEGFFTFIRYVIMSISAPAKALGWVSNKLGHGIDFLKIPDSIWDTENQDYFFKKDSLIKVLSIPDGKLKIVKELFTNKDGFDFTDISPEIINDIVVNQVSVIEKFIENYNNYVKNEIEDIFKTLENPQMQEKTTILSERIALICGIWNGVIDFVSSIFKFLGSLLEAPFDISLDFQHILEMMDNFWNMLKSGTLFTNIKNAVYEGIKQMTDYLRSKNSDDMNWVRIYYIAGFTISFIGTFFIPIADIAKVAEVGKLGEVLTKINSEIGKTISQTSKFVKIQTADAYKKAGKALEDLLLLFKTGGQKLRDFINNIWKKIADWFLKNKDVIKPRYEEIADLTSKELDWMASRNIGNLGGNILKETQIRKLRGTLKNKGLTLIVDGDINSITKLYKPVGGFKTFEDLMLFMKSSIPPKVGMFSAQTGQLILTKECTEIVAFHEMCHLKHFEEVGAEVYRGYNRLTKEMYVWKQIIAQRSRWTEAELNDAFNYINRVRVNEYGLKPLKIK